MIITNDEFCAALEIFGNPYCLTNTNIIVVYSVIIEQYLCRYNQLPNYSTHWGLVASYGVKAIGQLGPGLFSTTPLAGSTPICCQLDG